jgi:GT2 family glycosyltransferase
VQKEKFMSNEGQILYILVNFFNEREIVDFIDTELAAQSVPNLQVVVIDNGSSGKLLEDIQRRGVKLLRPGANLGYLGAANFAIKQYTTSGTYPKSIILSNADMRFATSSSLNDLLTLSPVEADVLGPAILSSSYGENLNPFYEKRISRSKLRFLITVFSVYPAYLAYQFLGLLSKKIKKNTNANGNDSRYVYALHGSIMVFRDTFFQKAGNLDYGSFLFAEELYIAEIAVKNSIRLYMNSSVKVFHEEHTTTGTFKKPKYVKWMKESLTFIHKNYFQ